MNRLEFSWDLPKARDNKRKHGISFEEARSVFYDDNAMLIYDPDHSDEEERFILLGMSASLRLLVVCHTYRGGESLIRIISARRATRRERQQYADLMT